MPTILTFSEAGGHVANEDAFEVRAHPLDSGVTLCLVADGMGGQAGGGLAARTACRVGAELACGMHPDDLGTPAAWLGLLSRVDEAVFAEDGAGYTTLIGFVVRGDTLVGASSGDSAVLAVRAGERPVILTAGQHKDPPVGSGGAPFVPFITRLASPWRVLAMTDGVWKYVGWDRLMDLATAAGGPPLMGRLQEQARLKGSGRFQDDFTVIVLEG